MVNGGFYGKYINMIWLKKLGGQVGLVQVIGWGLSLAVAVTGFMWTKISSTDADVGSVKVEQSKTNERVAKVEEAITTIKTDNAEIKQDIKTLLQRTK